MESIEDGSMVIFNFGEIDCREGILTAVAQNKYQDLDQGIDASVSIYVEMLEEQTLSKNLITFVHPIVPVLDPTRPTVKRFNQRLRKKIKSSKYLKYLDFFDELLSKDGQNFNEAYALDGTHMSPKYLPKMEESINRALAE
mmetsp:Transcript_5538/g.9262  ORF Transcript_5538/g.9262 Transcript_5538/m.9262 type:complete len:141 (+) Transcript_5538:136-558(+)